MSSFKELDEFHTVDLEANLMLNPVLSKDEQTPFVHYYRAEIGRLCIYKQRLDSTVNWTVTSCIFILSMSVQKIIPHNISIMLSILTLLLFQIIDVRRYINYDDIKMRCNYMEKGMYACILSPELCDKEWKNKLLNSWVKPNRMSFVKALYVRFRNVFVFLYVFHICVYSILLH